GLERGRVDIGRAAKTLPARNRNKTFETGLVRFARQPEIVVPACVPPLRQGREGQSARAIRAEEAQFEHVAAEETGISRKRHGARRRMLPLSRRRQDRMLLLIALLPFDRLLP